MNHANDKDGLMEPSGNVFAKAICPILQVNAVKSNPWMTTHSMDEILMHLENNATSDDIVVFDCDFTLWMPSDPVLQMKIVASNWNHVTQTFGSLTQEENAVFKALYCKQIEQVLIQQNLPERIQKLQERGVKCIAISEVLAGPIEESGKTTQEFRCEQLKKLGIDFSKSFPNLNNTSFCQLQASLGYYPAYHQGVILTNPEKNTKQELLEAFVGYSGFKPKKTYIIEDMEHNAKVYKTGLDEASLNHQIFLYTGATEYPKDEVAKNITQEDFIKKWEDLVKQTKELTPKIEALRKNLK